MFSLVKYEVLYELARVLETPGARPFHEAMRKLELHVLAPAFLRGTLATWGRDVEFHFRHSVREPGEFNFLLSDVDFDIVLRRDFSRDELVRLREKLEFLRKNTGFMGEAEIFPFDEHEELKRLEAANGDAYSFLRWVRKLRWMEATISKPGETYHHFKAERSNSVTRKKIARHLGKPLETDLSEMVATWLGERFPSLPEFAIRGPLWVDYLGYWLVPHGSEPVSQPALTLEPTQIATLAALVPDIFHGAPENVELAKARRAQDSRLLEAWHQMVSIEELRQRAWGRAQGALPRDFESWVGTLAGWRRSI